MKKISILIALRNEERIILSCLENLKRAINEFYQGEKNKNNFEIEILLGDDNSDDKSAEIINEFIKKNQNTNYTYFKIDKVLNKINQNNLKGKVNVIHQLINQSEGETLILLDADILVNQNWLQELIKKYYQKESIKMVMGTTIPKINQESFFTNFQTIDWIFGQGVLAIFSKLGFPQTAMGNNLAFDKKIYQELGGYENIQFSVTEDVALFKAFQNYINGCWWRQQQKKQNCQTLQSVRQVSNPQKNKNQFFLQLFNSKSLAFTEAELTLKDWILQHHRWFCGAWQFSNFIKKGLLITYLFRIIFFIGIVVGIFLGGNSYLILAVFTILGINYLLILSFLVKLKLKISLSIFLQVFLFCLLEQFLYLLVGIHFLKTKKVKWKGREF
ncbi:glycosyltransferase [Bernardetia sp. MNP-M8]|uniref:glycosyltransferase n=1 Tax=Bernardetia sp. MNP-M8 TaxID=3127470 RepID=UPI0030CDDF4D